MSVKRYSVGVDGVDPNGNLVKYTDYAALEARCAALAEENAGLKEWSPNPHSASMFEAIEKAEKLMDDGMPELAMIEAFEILKMKRTPATDAFLAEVRAQGVEMLREHPAIKLCSLTHVCDEFAAQLREGGYLMLTPAETDAFLAEVRAQGVEMFAESQKEYVRKNRDELDSMTRAAYCGSAVDAERFAAQLRQEATQ